MNASVEDLSASIICHALHMLSMVYTELSHIHDALDRDVSAELKLVDDVASTKVP